MERRAFFGLFGATGTAMALSDPTAGQTLDMWAIVELMGHVRVAGRVTEEERFGVKMGRIDIPRKDGSFVTQYFSGGSVYRVTPTTEEVARKIENRNAMPVQPYEMATDERPARAETVLEYLEDTFDDDGDGQEPF